MIGMGLDLENRKLGMTELIKINAGFATIGQGAGPMMVTWKAGLFRKHGLDIDRPQVMGGAKGVVRGLMSGEIQFGNLAAPAPLRANLKGEADVVFLTGGINQQFLVGRPGIGRREELSGKKIGTVNDGGIGDALVKFVIAKLEADGIKGLQEVTIGHGALAEMEALLSGKVDVVVGTPPECIDAIRHGCKNDRTKKVQCSVTFDTAGELLIVIRDPGPGFNVDEVPNPLEGSNVFKPSGRGVFLINQLMDTVEYSDEGRRVVMRKRIDAKA